MNILIVCSSNICRSPYAEFMLKRMIEQNPVLKDKGISVCSSAVFNQSKVIHPKAVKCLLAEGFDEETVKAHQPTFKRSADKRFAEADVIIGMSKGHGLLTPKKYRSKFTTLSEAAIGYYVPVPDPFLYVKQEKYDEVMNVIKELLELYVAKLEEEYTE